MKACALLEAQQQRDEEHLFKKIFCQIKKAGTFYICEV